MEKVGPPETPAPAPTPDDFIGKKPNIPEELYKIPELGWLGIDEKKDCGPLLYPGGETEALKRMEKYLASKKYICDF